MKLSQFCLFKGVLAAFFVATSQSANAHGVVHHISESFSVFLAVALIALGLAFLFGLAPVRRTVVAKGRKMLLVAAGMLSLPAHAHHPMGGTIPSNFTEGLLSGIGHPVIELDHFVFLIALSFVLALMKKRYMLQLAFMVVAFSAIGTFSHLMGMNDFGLSEGMVMVSLLAAALIILLGWARGIASWLLAGMAFFHGYAFAEAVAGAEATPISAYLLGLALVEFAILVTSSQVFRYLRESSISALFQERIFGTFLMMSGLALLMMTRLS